MVLLTNIVWLWQKVLSCVAMSVHHTPIQVQKTQVHFSIVVVLHGWSMSRTELVTFTSNEPIASNSSTIQMNMIDLSWINSLTGNLRVFRYLVWCLVPSALSACVPVGSSPIHLLHLPPWAVAPLAEPTGTTKMVLSNLPLQPDSPFVVTPQQRQYRQLEQLRRFRGRVASARPLMRLCAPTSPCCGGWDTSLCVKYEQIWHSRISFMTAFMNICIDVD